MPETNDTAAPAKAEQPKEWIFTFGSGQAHPNGFVRIHGTFTGAREEMFRRHGPAWCMQYESEEQAGVSRWGMYEVKGG